LARIKDTDYLQLSAYIRARETKLLNRDRIERMLEAPTTGDALKVLEECGWGDLSSLGPDEFEMRLGTYLKEQLDDIEELVPDKRFVEAVRLKYDFHNIKVLIKSEAVGEPADRLMSRLANIEPELLKAAYLQKDYSSLPKGIADSISEAAEILAKTGDPQLMDFVLDRYYSAEFLRLAEEIGSSFLLGYIRLFIDCANLRAFVRASRLGKDAEFLMRALIEGGNISPNELVLSAGSVERFLSLYSSSELCEAAEAGAEAIRGGRLTDFERLTDNALTDYLDGARFISFGEAPVVAYLNALEGEVSTIRIIVTGRRSGLSPADIRRHLREV
jgi:V/A-type H+-transporting ATPase subunit C